MRSFTGKDAALQPISLLKKNFITGDFLSIL